MARSDDLLFREVDEEVRAERLRQLWQRFGSWIVTLCVAVVLGTIGYEFWHNRLTSQNQEATSQILFGQEALQRNQFATAQQRFAAVQSGQDEIQQLAKLQQAIAAQREGKQERATVLYRELATSATAEPIRSYAALQVSNWQAFPTGKEAFSAMASERRAVELLNQNKAKEAGEILTKALEDVALMESQRTRLSLLLEIAERRS
jgi:hypothetical protein